MRSIYFAAAYIALAVLYGTTVADDEAQSEEIKVPVNRVSIDQSLTTSGQPVREYFDVLANEGIEIVVNLAPPESHGSIADEGGLVGERGIVCVNIPVNWEAPERGHFDFFSELLKNNKHKKTLVHCQVGFRASTFAFLHRVVHRNVEPDVALQALQEVWVPNETWKAFANEVLSDHDVDFQLD